MVRSDGRGVFSGVRGGNGGATLCQFLEILVILLGVCGGGGGGIWVCIT